MSVPGLAFIQAAKDVGIDFSTLLPRLACDYSWGGDAKMQRKQWLNGILQALCSDVEPGLTSHGLKATPLSWVMKANYGDRTIFVLGHHLLGSKGKTSEAYGRDVQAGPLRDFQDCLRAIRVGNIMADMNCSGMMRMPLSSFSLVQGPHPGSSQGDASVSSPAKLKVAPDATKPSARRVHGRRCRPVPEP